MEACCQSMWRVRGPSIDSLTHLMIWGVRGVGAFLTAADKLVWPYCHHRTFILEGKADNYEQTNNNTTKEPHSLTLGNFWGWSGRRLRDRDIQDTKIKGRARASWAQVEERGGEKWGNSVTCSTSYHIISKSGSAVSKGQRGKRRKETRELWGWAELS